MTLLEKQLTDAFGPLMAAGEARARVDRLINNNDKACLSYETYRCLYSVQTALPDGSEARAVVKDIADRVHDALYSEGPSFSGFVTVLMPRPVSEVTKKLLSFSPVVITQALAAVMQPTEKIVKIGGWVDILDSPDIDRRPAALSFSYRNLSPSSSLYYDQPTDTFWEHHGVQGGAACFEASAQCLAQVRFGLVLDPKTPETELPHSAQPVYDRINKRVYPCVLPNKYVVIECGLC